MALPTAPVHCFFLDALPPELRLSIYEYLVLASEPLHGETAQQHQTGIDLAIFRTNRQIYQEARSLFLSKNTFCITSVPHNASAERPHEGGDELRVLYAPSFSKADMRLVRHLAIDPVYRSAEAMEETSDAEDTWQRADPGAAEYIQALTDLLRSTNLRSLSITATPPHHFTTKQCLTSFFMADRDRGFAAALAAHSTLTEIRVSFEFPDCYYRVSVTPVAFMQRSILLLACRVMFCQSQTRLHRLMMEFDPVSEEMDESAELKSERPRVNLEPLVECSVKFYPRVDWTEKS